LEGKRPQEEKAADGDAGSGSCKRRAVGGTAPDAKLTPITLDVDTVTDLVQETTGTNELGEIELIVKTSDGRTIIYLEVNLSGTVKRIQEKSSFCTETKCLLLNSMQLEDDRTLDYKNPAWYDHLLAAY
jgi:hypothetical protein